MKLEFSTLANEFRLNSEILLNRNLDEVFAYFSDAKNLEELTPPFLNFKIITPTPIEMKEGAIIDYKIIVRFLPIYWRTLINVWNPPHLFVDEQIKGPYRYWIHQHSFEAQGEKTLVRDYVRYQVFGGKIVHKLFVEPDLVKIFSYRQEKLLEKFS